jgi:hypothetical protein
VNHILMDFTDKPVRTLVVWEPVLFTDWSSPSTVTLGRITAARVSQFWDRGRLISHSMGEHDRRTIVWDNIAVYPIGAIWESGPPAPLYKGGPVVRVTDEARAAIAQALNRDEVRQAK